MSQVGSLPLLRLTVAAKTPADARDLASGMALLAASDPTLRVSMRGHPGSATISAVDEPQLENLVRRLKSDFGVDALVFKPEVAFKETFVGPTIGEGRYVRQAGGRGQYAHVKIHVIPLPPGSGFRVENKIVDGAIPQQFIEPVSEGIYEAFERGPVAGYPVDDVRVEVFSGSYHDTDSSEGAFKIAGVLAVQDAGRGAKCVVTEPVMQVEIRVPDRYVRDVTHDLASRRADIQSREAWGETNVIRARVPLRALLGYESELRTKTGGRGSCVMTLDRYEPMYRRDDGSGDPDAHVTAPLQPAPYSRSATIALPEPD